MLQALQSGLSTFVNYLPQLLGAIVVLVVGFIIAYVLRRIITKLLRRLRLDERLTSGSGGHHVARFSPQGSPALLIGKVLFWVIMIFVITSAVGTLGIPPLTNFMNLVLSYLPNVIAALLILVVAAAVAGAVGGLVHTTMGDTPTGRVVRAGAPALIMAIAVFMVLTQLGIAPVIVTATYIAIISAAALASALAFGLGGRDAAAELINSGYRKAQEQSEQVRADLATGRDRGRERAEQYQQTPTQQAPAQQPPTQQAPAQQPPTQQAPAQQPPTQQNQRQQTEPVAPRHDGQGRGIGGRRS